MRQAASGVVTEGHPRVCGQGKNVKIERNRAGVLVSNPCIPRSPHEVGVEGLRDAHKRGEERAASSDVRCDKRSTPNLDPYTSSRTH